MSLRRDESPRPCIWWLKCLGVGVDVPAIATFAPGPIISLMLFPGKLHISKSSIESVTGYDSQFAASSSLHGGSRAPSWQMSAPQNYRPNPFAEHNHRAELYSPMNGSTFPNIGAPFFPISNMEFLPMANPFSDYDGGHNAFQQKADASNFSSRSLGACCKPHGQLDQISGSLRFETDICIATESHIYWILNSRSFQINNKTLFIALIFNFRLREHVSIQIPTCPFRGALWK